MPTVPVQDIPTVDLQAANVVPFQAPSVEPMRNAAPDQMQKFGQATVQAATAMNTIADRIQNELDDAATKEADNLLSDSLRTSIYDPEKGYLSTVGKPALDSRKATIDSMNEAKQKVEQTLTTDMQRKMFNQVANRRLQTAMTQVDSHAMQQAKVYNVAESKARATASVQDAVANANTWNMKDADGKPAGPYNLYKSTAISEMNSLADTMGMAADSAQRKELVLAATTQIASEVVSGMVASDQAAQARDYLSNAIKAKEIDSTKVDQLQNLVKTAGVKDDSLRLSMTLKGGLNTQLATIDQMFKDGKISADVRDATVQRAEHNYTRMKTMENEGNKVAMGSFQEWIIKNPGKSIVDAPANLYNWAKNQGQLAGLDGFAKREGAPSERRKELEVRGILMDLAVNDPTQFVKEFKDTGFVNRLDLGTNGIKEMQNMAVSIVQNNGKFKTAFDTKVLQDAIPAALLKNGAKDKKDAFVAIMSEETNKWIAENPGKTPDSAAYQRVISTANREWVSIGSMWNDEIPAYEARRLKEGKAVPKDFYDSMKKLGAKEDEIVKAWLIKKGQQ
jgi:hypothetical protein